MGSLRWHASVHILLATLFVSGALVALAPVAEAQTIYLSAREGAYEYGWTFPEGDGFPGAAAEDAAGDTAVAVEDTGAVPVGAAPVAQALDLVQVAVDEPDAEVLRLVIHVADLDPQRILIDHSFFGARYETRFSLGGADYRIVSYVWVGCKEGAEVCEPYTDPAATVRSQMHRIMPDDAVPVGYLPSRALADSDRIEVLIPRWALDGPRDAAAPLADDPVRDLHVSADGGYICIFVCFRTSDRLPDEGSIAEFHTLALDSNGARVRIMDGRGVAVNEDGEPQMRPLTPRVLYMDIPTDGDAQVPIRVENLVGQKALVLPSAEVLSEHDVTLRVPKSLEVPAQDLRKLLIGLDGNTAFALDDPLVLKLSIETVGTRPATDVATVLVRSVPTLSPEAPRLYLHTYDGGSLWSDLGIEQFAYSYGVLNTLADDPLDDGRGAEVNSFCFCINSPYQWSSLSGVPETVHLDPETGARLHLEVDAPVAGTLALQPMLGMGDTAVAMGDHSVELDQGANTVEVPLRVPEETTEIEPGEGTFRFEFRARFRPAGVAGGEFVALAAPVNPTMKTGGASWLELPVVDATHRFANATHITVDLDRGVDRVQYLNPGRTTLWNVTIANQADQEDTVTISATVPDDWKSRVAPGSSYRLGPGESVTVGIHATAPEESGEGTTVDVVVAVASKLAEGAAAGTRLSAVVTNGAPIPEPTYIVDNTTSARLADETASKESPGLPFLVGLLVALLPVMARRRRQR